MPRFDQACGNCSWTAEIIVRPFEQPVCPVCGHETHRVWVKPTAMARDEIPGGQVIENLGHEPMMFYSQSEIVKEAKRRGLEPFVRHVPVPGTDKSPHTTNWAVVSPYQLQQAAELVRRVTSVKPNEEPEEPHVDADTRELVRSIFGE